MIKWQTASWREFNSLLGKIAWGDNPYKHCRAVKKREDNSKDSLHDITFINPFMKTEDWKTLKHSNLKCEDRTLQNCLDLKTVDLATTSKDFMVEFLTWPYVQWNQYQGGHCLKPKPIHSSKIPCTKSISRFWLWSLRSRNTCIFSLSKAALSVRQQHHHIWKISWYVRQ